jgi:hypothetical protein
VEAGEQIKVLAAGLLPSQDPHLVIAGYRPTIQIGDRVTINSTLFEITKTDDRWHAFTVCKLRQVTPK